MRQTKAAEHYDEDFDLWVKAQVAALREGRFTALDVENVTEELEALAKRDRRKIKSKLRQLETHLLKLQHQPERETVSWRVPIAKERAAIHDILDDSRSLRREMDGWIFEVYPAAREQARLETKMLRSDLPAEPSRAFLKVLGRMLGKHLGVFPRGKEIELSPADLPFDDYEPPDDDASPDK